MSDGEVLAPTIEERCEKGSLLTRCQSRGRPRAAVQSRMQRAPSRAAFHPGLEDLEDMPRDAPALARPVRTQSILRRRFQELLATLASQLLDQI